MLRLSSASNTPGGRNSPPSLLFKNIFPLFYVDLGSHESVTYSFAIISPDSIPRGSPAHLRWTSQSPGSYILVHPFSLSWIHLLSRSGVPPCPDAIHHFSLHPALNEKLILERKGHIQGLIWATEENLPGEFGCPGTLLEVWGEQSFGLGIAGVLPGCRMGKHFEIPSFLYLGSQNIVMSLGKSRYSLITCRYGEMTVNGDWSMEKLMEISDFQSFCIGGDCKCPEKYLPCGFGCRQHP